MEKILIEPDKMTDEEIEKYIKNGEFELDIPNFKKWNPDSRSHRIWFALKVDWWRDPKIIRLSPTQRCMWIQLIALRATEVQLLGNLTYTAVILMMNLRGTAIIPGLIKLLKLGLIELRCSALHNITIQTIHKEQLRNDVFPNAEQPRKNKRCSPRAASEFDFNSLYQKYPRKVGRKKGLEICKRQIKSLGQYEKLSKAIDRYRSDCSSRRTEEKYIKHFSTFMASWEDWTGEEPSNTVPSTPSVRECMPFEEWVKLPEAQEIMAEINES